MPIRVRHEGHLFSIEEMTRTGEKHKRDVAAFFSQGPGALDAIVLDDPTRIFAMLSCYYKFPWIRDMYAAHCGAMGAVEAVRVEEVEAVEAAEAVEAVEAVGAVGAAKAEVDARAASGARGRHGALAVDETRKEQVTQIAQVAS